MPEIIPVGEYLGNTANRTAVRGLLLTESTYEKGAAFPPHTHEGAFFYLVLSGACTERFRDEERTDSSHSLVFHGPGQTHQTRWPSSGRCLHLGFTSARWNQIEESAPGIEVHSAASRGLPSVIARRLYEEFRSGDAFSPLAIEGLALEIVAEVGRGSSKPRPGSKLLARAMEILDSRLSEEWSLWDVAAEVGCAPSYLARVFRSETGATMGAYVRKRRVEWACRAIRTRDLPLGMIAQQAGFYDQSHFTRAFKAVTGISPSAYRRMHLG